MIMNHHQSHYVNMLNEACLILPIFTIVLSLLAHSPCCADSKSKPIPKLEAFYIWSAYDQTAPKEKTEKAKDKLSNIHQPSLTIFRPKKPNGTAVVICPGGGYSYLAVNKEGYRVARKLSEFGITAFVLKYRLPTTQGVDFKHPVPLSDALRGIQWVRYHHDEYGIQQDRIGIMGFSAGGHLAASASTLHSQYAFGKDDIAQASSRPDFACLGYPVITTDPQSAHNCVQKLFPNRQPDKTSTLKSVSCELNIRADSSPTFLFHAKDDKGVKYENSLLMHQALQKQGISAELKIYEKGGHGFGLGRKGMENSQWVSQFLSWLRGQKMLPEDAQ